MGRIFRPKGGDTHFAVEKGGDDTQPGLTFARNNDDVNTGRGHEEGAEPKTTNDERPGIRPANSSANVKVSTPSWPYGRGKGPNLCGNKPNADQEPTWRSQRPHPRMKMPERSPHTLCTVELGGDRGRLITDGHCIITGRHKIDATLACNDASRGEHFEGVQREVTASEERAHCAPARSRGARRIDP